MSEPKEQSDPARKIQMSADRMQEMVREKIRMKALEKHRQKTEGLELGAENLSTTVSSSASSSASSSSSSSSSGVKRPREEEPPKGPQKPAVLRKQVTAMEVDSGDSARENPTPSAAKRARTVAAEPIASERKESEESSAAAEQALSFAKPAAKPRATASVTASSEVTAGRVDGKRSTTEKTETADSTDVEMTDAAAKKHDEKLENPFPRYDDEKQDDEATKKLNERNLLMLEQLSTQDVDEQAVRKVKRKPSSSQASNQPKSGTVSATASAAVSASVSVKPAAAPVTKVSTETATTEDSDMESEPTDAPKAQVKPTVKEKVEKPQVKAKPKAKSEERQSSSSSSAPAALSKTSPASPAKPQKSKPASVPVSTSKPSVAQQQQQQLKPAQASDAKAKAKDSKSTAASLAPKKAKDYNTARMLALVFTNQVVADVSWLSKDQHARKESGLPFEDFKSPDFAKTFVDMADLANSTAETASAKIDNDEDEKRLDKARTRCVIMGTFISDFVAAELNGLVPDSEEHKRAIKKIGAFMATGLALANSATDTAIGFLTGAATVVQKNEELQRQLEDKKLEVRQLQSELQLQTMNRDAPNPGDEMSDD